MYHASVNVSFMVENVTRIKSGITISVGVSVKILKEHNSCEQDYILNPATSSGENGKYVGSITEDSGNTSVEIIPTTKISLTKTSFYTSLTFLLITIVLLIAVSAYCYLIKYKSKRTFIAILRRK